MPKAGLFLRLKSFGPALSKSNEAAITSGGVAIGLSAGLPHFSAVSGSGDGRVEARPGSVLAVGRGG